VIRYIVDVGGTLDPPRKKKPDATELEVARLEGIQTELARLIESASTAGQAVESRLRSLASKPGKAKATTSTKKKPVPTTAASIEKKPKRTPTR
jgi:hypothetical protein